MNLHDFELALTDPCLAMTKRGVTVDEPLRVARIKELDAQRARLSAQTSAIVLPLLVAGMPQEQLFKKTKRCKCCHAGSKKSKDCSTCGGKPCKPCAGAGRDTWWEFNPSSNQQIKVVLYDLLGMKEITRQGKRKSDEQTLKVLAKTDTTGLCESLLRLARHSTMGQIYTRIKPAADGRVHTFYNVAGTETGRFASSGGSPFG